MVELHQPANHVFTTEVHLDDIMTRGRSGTSIFPYTVTSEPF